LHAGLRGSGWKIFPLFFSLYVKDMPTPSHHVDFALYADDTAIISTSREPAVLISSSFQGPGALAEKMEDRHHRLDEHRNALR
jgi:hypothetical protein